VRFTAPALTGWRGRGSLIGRIGRCVMIVVLLAASALLSGAEPAAAAAPATAPAARMAQASTTVTPAVVNGKKAPDPNQVICRSEPVLGTLFPKKTCATRAELADRAAQDQKATREATSIRPYRDPNQ
jgi:hypothetical protein